MREGGRSGEGRELERKAGAGRERGKEGGREGGKEGGRQQQSR